jgi:hypothetical protein
LNSCKTAIFFAVKISVSFAEEFQKRKKLKKFVAQIFTKFLWRRKNPKKNYKRRSRIMVLKTTMEQMKQLIQNIQHDLDKVGKGNKAAAQRVRTGSIEFAKTAKVYRKESIAEFKKSDKKVILLKKVKKVKKRK